MPSHAPDSRSEHRDFRSALFISLRHPIHRHRHIEGVKVIPPRQQPIYHPCRIAEVKIYCYGRKRPQECPNYIATTSDSSASYRRSEKTSMTKAMSMTLETYTLTTLRRWDSTSLAQILIPPLLQGRRVQEENQGRVRTETVITGARSRPTVMALIPEPLCWGIPTLSSVWVLETDY